MTPIENKVGVFNPAFLLVFVYKFLRNCRHRRRIEVEYTDNVLFSDAGPVTYV